MLLFWQAPPTEHQNGIIREYHVELSNNSTSINYTTEGPFLLLDNLKPNTDYNCSIAAYTIMRGPFSQPITISLRPENYSNAYRVVCFACGEHVYSLASKSLNLYLKGKGSGDCVHHENLQILISERCIYHLDIWRWNNPLLQYTKSPYHTDTLNLDLGIDICGFQDYR